MAASVTRISMGFFFLPPTWKNGEQNKLGKLRTKCSLFQNLILNFDQTLWWNWIIRPFMPAFCCYFNHHISVDMFTNARRIKIWASVQNSVSRYLKQVVLVVIMPAEWKKKYWLYLFFIYLDVGDRGNPINWKTLIIIQQIDRIMEDTSCIQNSHPKQVTIYRSGDILKRRNWTTSNICLVLHTIYSIKLYPKPMGITLVSCIHWNWWPISNATKLTAAPNLNGQFHCYWTSGRYIH